MLEQEAWTEAQGMSENALAKLQWIDPVTGKLRDFVLTEGATVVIGRSSTNDIPIPEQHVSRQHAVISYRDGVFMVNDLGSSNGTYVNDTKVDEPFPLFAGDVIRLYVPTIKFLALMDGDVENATKTGQISIVGTGSQGSLIVTNGPQEGQTIPLLLKEISIGRAVSNATWEILIQDPSVSRPHARISQRGEQWYIVDLGSSNGTRLNKKPVSKEPVLLSDGDTMELGNAILLFRVGWVMPSEQAAKEAEAPNSTIPKRL